MNRELASEASVVLAARRAVAAAIGLALRDPAHGEIAAWAAGSAEVVVSAWEVCVEAQGEVERATLGLHELPARAADIGPAARWLSLRHEERAQAYRAVFGLVFSKQCPPYETEYCESRDVFHRSQHMADLGGFYRAFGVQPDAGQPERADHASLIIGFASFLLQRIAMLEGETASTREKVERRKVVGDAMTAFVRDHAAWWLPTFGRALETRVQELMLRGVRGPVEELAGVGRMVRAWSAAERIWAGVEPNRRILAPIVEEPEPEEEQCLASCSDCMQTGEPAAE